MAVDKIKLANKKYKHEAKRRAKRQADRSKALKEKLKQNSARKHRLSVERYVDELKVGLDVEA